MRNPQPQDPCEEDQFQFAVCCPVEKHLLGILRRFASSVAEEMGFDEDDVLKIELSVDEACSNIARHAYCGEDPARCRIELKIKMDPGALTVHVQDYGKGAEDGMRGTASLEDYRRLDREGYDGLGLLIIHKFMDQVRVESRPGAGTTIVMRKFLGSGNKS